MGDQLALFDMPQTTRTSDDYWTPKWLFDALGLVFDIDVACPPEGPAHTPCKRFFTQADDGLAQPWEGRVFMNPPFSKVTPWVHKWLEHANEIAVLPFARSKWCNDVWQSKASICMLPSSMQYVQGSIFLPSMMIALGRENIEALRRLGPVR